MTSQIAFQRSTINLSGKPLPALTNGRKAWLFGGSGVIELPSWLLKAPDRALSWLLQDHLTPAPNDSTLAVTVIPQMNCNAACGYCIQNIRSGPTGVERMKGVWMNDQVLRATLAFIERQRQAQGKTSVSLTLFGGEPLLNPERCYRLLEGTKHLSGASIITNSYLLTPVVAQRLTDLGVGSLQVTFDGAQPDHDQVRVLAANGDGTYHTIVQNLAQIDQLAVLPFRKIRVNVTQSNLARLTDLVNDLAQQLTPSHWILYFDLVDDNDIGWNDGLTPSQDVGTTLANLARQAAALGFGVPMPGVSGSCGFCSKSFGSGGAVVNGDGTLYSCWDSAGFLDMAVGNVWRGYVPPEGNEAKWVMCSYKSTNRGPSAERESALGELSWTLRELVAASKLA